VEEITEEGCEVEQRPSETTVAADFEEVSVDDVLRAKPSNVFAHTCALCICRLRVPRRRTRQLHCARRPDAEL
jgi:hypothetical protein